MYGEVAMTVGELTTRIRGLLEPHFEHVDVEGEISNLYHASSGHMYFTLKDDAAMIQAVSFNHRTGKKTTAVRLAEGMQVRVTGKITVYGKRGSYQIICTTITELGSGAILAMLEKRKQMLAAEGLFDEQKKQPIPQFARSVALITAPRGAAIRDFLEVTRRRNRSIDIVVVPCLVQGDEAAERICQRLAYINHHHLAEVIVITRGGGSLEDLLPFSDERVVRAVSASNIPVVAAIGHEIDVSLCELAADTRASTPSVAAELISIERQSVLQRLADAKMDLKQVIIDKTRYMRNTLTHYKPERLRQIIDRTIGNYKLTLDGQVYRLHAQLKELLNRRRNQLESHTAQLHLLSPLAILQRGFSIVEEVDTGVVVTDSSTQQIGNMLNVRLANGGVMAQVTDLTTPSK